MAWAVLLEAPDRAGILKNRQRSTSVLSSYHIRKRRVGSRGGLEERRFSGPLGVRELTSHRTPKGSSTSIVRSSRRTSPRPVMDKVSTRGPACGTIRSMVNSRQPVGLVQPQGHFLAGERFDHQQAVDGTGDGRGHVDPAVDPHDLPRLRPARRDW